MVRSIKGLGLVVVVAALAACGKGGDKPAGGDQPPVAPKSSQPEKSVGEAPATVAPAAVETGPIAKINGVEVDRAEFDKKYAKMTKAFTTRNKDIPEGLALRYKESILKQLIDKELLQQEIQKQNVQVDPGALDAEFEEYKKMFRTDENFDRYLKSSEVTIEQIKENIKHNLAVNALLDKAGGLALAEDEVKKYFEENRARYEVKEQIRASHILFKVEKADDAAADAEARKQAEEVYKLATAKGANFEELAKKHSQGPTAPRGGDLSYFTRGRMVPAFEEVAFAMKVGEISKPVKTQFGWHIIQVNDRKEGRDRPFDEVKESIEKLLKNKASRKAKADLLKTLREQAKVESFLPEVPKIDVAAPGADTDAVPGELAPPGEDRAPASAVAPGAATAPGSTAAPVSAGQP